MSSDGRTAEAQVQVSVTDVDDNAPVITGETTGAVIEGGRWGGLSPNASEVIGFTGGKVTASDKDVSHELPLTLQDGRTSAELGRMFESDSPNPSHGEDETEDDSGTLFLWGMYGTFIFHTYETKGWVRTETDGWNAPVTNAYWMYVLDRDAEAVLALAEGEVVTETFTLVSGETTQDIVITITGADDAKPTGITITPTAYGELLPEDTDTSDGVFLATVDIIDDERGTNWLSWRGDDELFELRNGNEFWLKEGAELDAETRDTYRVRFSVDGTGTGDRPDSQYFTLNIGNVSEHDVVFTEPHYVVDVAENEGDASTPRDIVQVSASDADADTTITYSIVWSDDTLGNDVSSDFEIAADGTLRYVGRGLDAETAYFWGNAVYTIHLGVRATSSDGSFADAQVTIFVTDVDEYAPVITGDTTGAVAEDGDQTARGTLEATDNDVSQTAFLLLTGATGSSSYNNPPHQNTFTLQGTYGTVVFTAVNGGWIYTANGGWSIAGGEWVYTLDNDLAAVQALSAGETATETFTFTSGDTTQTLTITIDGADDAAVITGDTSGAVTEDGDQTARGRLEATDGDISQTATLTLQDAVGSSSYGPGTAHNTFTAQGTYGTLVLTPAGGGWIYTGGEWKITVGDWVYTLDNDSAAVQALGEGETATDTFTFASGDTTQTLTITITGTDDAPTIVSPPPSPDLAVSELADTLVEGETYSFNVNLPTDGLEAATELRWEIVLRGVLPATENDFPETDGTLTLDAGATGFRTVEIATTDDALRELPASNFQLRVYQVVPDGDDILLGAQDVVLLDDDAPTPPTTTWNGDDNIIAVSSDLAAIYDGAAGDDAYIVSRFQTGAATIADSGAGDADVVHFDIGVVIVRVKETREGHLHLEFASGGTLTIERPDDFAYRLGGGDKFAYAAFKAALADVGTTPFAVATPADPAAEGSDSYPHRTVPFHIRENIVTANGDGAVTFRAGHGDDLYVIGRFQKDSVNIHNEGYGENIVKFDYGVQIVGFEEATGTTYGGLPWTTATLTLANGDAAPEVVIRGAASYFHFQFGDGALMDYDAFKEAIGVPESYEADRVAVDYAVPFPAPADDGATGGDEADLSVSELADSVAEGETYSFTVNLPTGGLEAETELRWEIVLRGTLPATGNDFHETEGTLTLEAGATGRRTVEIRTDNDGGQESQGDFRLHVYQVVPDGDDILLVVQDVILTDDETRTRKWNTDDNIIALSAIKDTKFDGRVGDDAYVVSRFQTDDATIADSGTGDADSIHFDFGVTITEAEETWKGLLKLTFATGGTLTIEKPDDFAYRLGDSGELSYAAFKAALGAPTPDAPFTVATPLAPIEKVTNFFVIRSLTGDDEENVLIANGHTLPRLKGKDGDDVYVIGRFQKSSMDIYIDDAGDVVKFDYGVEIVGLEETVKSWGYFDDAWTLRSRALPTLVLTLKGGGGPLNPRVDLADLSANFGFQFGDGEVMDYAEFKAALEEAGGRYNVEFPAIELPAPPESTVSDLAVTDLAAALTEGATYTFTIDLPSDGLSAQTDIRWEIVSKGAKPVNHNDFAELAGTLTLARDETGAREISLRSLHDGMAEHPENFELRIYRVVPDGDDVLVGAQDVILTDSDDGTPYDLETTKTTYSTGETHLHGRGGYDDLFVVDRSRSEDLVIYGGYRYPSYESAVDIVKFEEGVEITDFKMTYWGGVFGVSERLTLTLATDAEVIIFSKGDWQYRYQFGDGELMDYAEFKAVLREAGVEISIGWRPDTTPFGGIVDRSNAAGPESIEAGLRVHTVITSAHGDTIDVGHRLPDDITLGAGDDTVIYDIDSGYTESAWERLHNPAGKLHGLGGRDHIRNFDRTSDKILFVDSDETPMTLAEFLDDVGEAGPLVYGGLQYVQLVLGKAGLEVLGAAIIFESPSNSGGTLRVDFKDPIKIYTNDDHDVTDLTPEYESFAGAEETNIYDRSSNSFRSLKDMSKLAQLLDAGHSYDTAYDAFDAIDVVGDAPVIVSSPVIKSAPPPAPPELTLSGFEDTLVEGETYSFTVNLPTDGLEAETEVLWEIIGMGTFQVRADDFEAMTGTLTLARGETDARQVSIRSLRDDQAERPETFKLRVYEVVEDAPDILLGAHAVILTNSADIL